MNVFGERQHPEKYIPVCIKRIRDAEKITIHSDVTKTIPGSRYYIHASDVASALLFILNLKDQYNGSKFNVVGKEEINNLQLAQMIADVQGKELIYELSDFHSARPGHDLRYALSGDYMRKLGWEPQISLKDRISEVVNWTLANDRWL
jgi:dTDP-glucose 4,6-dehydratase